MNSEFRIKNVELKFWSAVVLLLFISSKMVTAQPVDSLINEAVKNNPQLKAFEFKKQAAKFKIESTDNYPAPTVGVEFNQVPIGKFNVWDNAISQNLSFSQMFPLGGKISAMTEVERKNHQIAGSDLQVYKTNLIANVKMSYYSLWLIERKIQIQKENIKLLNGVIESIQTLYQVGKVSQADLLLLKSEVASNETQLTIFNNDRVNEIYKLNKLLGRDLNSFKITTTDNIYTSEKKLSEEELQLTLIESNPVLQKMSNMLEMNKAETVANDKELIPDLMLQGMIMRMPQGMLLTSKGIANMISGEPAKTEIMYGLMASITLPFAPWSKDKVTAKTEELNRNSLAISSELFDMKREMIMQLKQTISKLNSEKELMKLYEQKVIPLYESTVSAQISSYQNNLVSINSVLESTRMLLMQKMNHFMAQADYQMSLAEIEMMIGKQL